MDFAKLADDVISRVVVILAEFKNTRVMSNHESPKQCRFVNEPNSGITWMVLSAASRVMAYLHESDCSVFCIRFRISCDACLLDEDFLLMIFWQNWYTFDGKSVG